MEHVQFAEALSHFGDSPRFVYQLGEWVWYIDPDTRTQHAAVVWAHRSAPEGYVIQFIGGDSCHTKRLNVSVDDLRQKASAQSVPQSDTAFH